MVLTDRFYKASKNLKTYLENHNLELYIKSGKFDLHNSMYHNNVAWYKFIVEDINSIIQFEICISSEDNPNYLIIDGSNYQFDWDFLDEESLEDLKNDKIEELKLQIEDIKKVNIINK